MYKVSCSALGIRSEVGSEPLTFIHTPQNIHFAPTLYIQVYTLYRTIFCLISNLQRYYTVEEKTCHQQVLADATSQKCQFASAFVMASDAPATESGWISSTCKGLIDHGPRQRQDTSLAEGPDHRSQSRAIGFWVKTNTLQVLLRITVIKFA